jgi:hypothetical protein
MILWNLVVSILGASGPSAFASWLQFRVRPSPPTHPPSAAKSQRSSSSIIPLRGSHSRIQNPDTNSCERRPAHQQFKLPRRETECARSAQNSGLLCVGEREEKERGHLSDGHRTGALHVGPSVHPSAALCMCAILFAVSHYHEQRTQVHPPAVSRRRRSTRGANIARRRD